jgi:hypothetical protein
MRRTTFLLDLPTSLLLACTCWGQTRASPAKPIDDLRPFGIEVVDESTGRGVPLVELKTTANVRYFTDSAGLAAIDDPVLIGGEAFFYVSSHGYEFPADGFGFHGVRLKVTPGGNARVKIKRVNIAERLYRVTGEGIYRDSVILGRPAPIEHPLLDAQVSGQDSSLAAVYHGKIHWFFGDTFRPAYPLGHFSTAGAVSNLPGDAGGLDPAVGVNLEYYADADGFSRGTIPRTGAHPAWLDGLTVLPGDDGTERLVAKCSVMEGLGTCIARRLVVFNDEHGMFNTLKEIPLDVPLYPVGHPFRAESDGTKWIYFGQCWPNIRVKDDWKSLQDFSAYETFTCFTAGSRYQKDHARLDRDADGKLVWAWKKDTASLEKGTMFELLSSGKLKPDEVWFLPTDVETREPVYLGMGSVTYNAFRHKWVMIGEEIGGKSSFMGEIYYAEAERPEGPWPWARKIITHNRYSFYNPLQQPFFEEAGGRMIYFQGTYAATFSGNDDPTPRYDYNQLMYRLDLADPRLRFPEEAPPKPKGRNGSLSRLGLVH